MITQQAHVQPLNHSHNAALIAGIRPEDARDVHNNIVQMRRALNASVEYHRNTPSLNTIDFMRMHADRLPPEYILFECVRLLDCYEDVPKKKRGHHYREKVELLVYLAGLAQSLTGEPNPELACRLADARSAFGIMPPDCETTHSASTQACPPDSAAVAQA